MSWKRKIAALVGADGAKIIVVIAVSRASAQQSLSWLQSKKISGYPYWCFCSEDGESIPGFDRFVSGATAAQIGQDLRKQWCALTIVSWTGEPGYTRLKLSPLLRPPFRFLFLNDSGDFFGPGLIPTHTLRRLREAFFNATHFAKDFSLASVEWVVRNSRQQLEFLGSLRVAGYWKAYHGLDWSRSALRHVWTPVSGNIRARLISVFAFFAQFSTPLSRSVFARFKGTRQIDLGLAPLRDLSYVEIVIYVRKWPFAEIKRTIARATESIVIFRQDGETADLQGLLELFRQPATFVVALQVQHTDWRKKLLSKYPFRQLQPGEVTRTLAPYSSLLAMRRDALMQFGVPEVLSSGSAYMLLCWQAAAAHLHSYTVGGTRQGGQEIDVPLEHAEFVKTLLDKKKLRILAPGDAALSRGNIATSPQHHRPFTGKPRVLVLSPYLPYPLSHGGAVRIFNLCRSLCSRVDFILVCFREAKDTVHYEILGAIFREVYVVDNDERNRDPGLPKQIPEYRNSAMRALVGHLCTTRAIDLLQIEYTQMAEYGECANVPVLLVEHDVTFTLYRQIWEAERSRRAEEDFQRWIAFETKALKNANGIWAMSSHDRDVIVEQGASPETDLRRSERCGLAAFHPRVRNWTPRRESFSWVRFVIFRICLRSRRSGIRSCRRCGKPFRKLNCMWLPVPNMNTTRELRGSKPYWCRTPGSCLKVSSKTSGRLMPMRMWSRFRFPCLRVPTSN